MAEVIVVIGPGLIGQAIARRVGVGKRVLLADVREQSAIAAAETLGNAGYDAIVTTVDVSSRESVHALAEEAAALGDVTAPGGSGVVIASQSGHRLPALPAEQNQALATTPVHELLDLPFLQPDQVADSLHAYQLAKRGNSLRVMAEAVRWGERGARVNTISPGIVITPLARDELAGPRGDGYRRMIESSPVGRAGTPDEVGAVGALLMGPDGGFITGSDILMDGGVTAAYFYGDIPEVRT